MAAAGCAGHAAPVVFRAVSLCAEEHAAVGVGPLVGPALGEGGGEDLRQALTSSERILGHWQFRKQAAGSGEVVLSTVEISGRFSVVSASCILVRLFPSAFLRLVASGQGPVCAVTPWDWVSSGHFCRAQSLMQGFW